MKAGAIKTVTGMAKIVLGLIGGLILLCAGAWAIDANTFAIQRIEKSPFGNFNLSGINDVLQDQQGFFWLATENGLLRYDSLRTVKYESQKDNKNTLSSQYCWSLAEDHRGHIWIATENGLNEFDPLTKTFTRYLSDPDNPESLSHNFTTRVIESRDHQIYVATADGLTRISADRQTIQSFQASGQPDSILLSNEIRTLKEDHNGFIWIGYSDQGVTRWNPLDHSTQHFIHIVDSQNPQTQIHLRHIRDIEEDHSGRIWFGTYGDGAMYLDLAQQEFRQFRAGQSGLESPIIWDIFVDSNGSIWAGMDKGGMARFDEKQQHFQTFRHDPFDPNTLQHNTVKDIYEDRQANLWFATFPSGLNRHHPSVEQFSLYYHRGNNKNTLSHSAILSLTRSRDGMLWIGTENGLNSLDERSGTITRYQYNPNDPHSLPAPAALSVAEGPDGSIWVGTWSGGLAKLNRHSGRFDRFAIGEGKHALKSPYVWRVFFDSQQRLWVATETDGLAQYLPESDTFKRYFHDKGDPNSISFNYVWDITEQQNGLLWIGTQHGLNLFDPATGKFERFDEVEDFHGLGNARVQALVEDSQGYVWVGTHSEGLKRWDPNTETIINITVESGLPSNSIAALVEDNQGYIWASTIAGIVKVNPRSLNIEQILTRANGIAGNHHNRNAVLKGKDGAVYFGSSEGLTQFYPTQLRLPERDPQVLLTDFRIFNRSANVGEANSPLTRDISTTPAISLDHQTDMFSLEFTSLDFSSSQEMHFSYRLDGFDSDWNNIRNRNEAIYTNLDPGNYVFKVRAQKQNGQWSDQVTSLAITVKPPPWLGPSAYLIYAATAICIIYLLVRVVLLRLLAARLNEEVAKRTKELSKASKAKTEFLANMSHELRTPLNSIIGFSKRLMLKYESQLDHQGLNALDAIHRNGLHLLNLITDILDLSKIESGKMELKFSPCNLKELIASCIADLHEAAAEKGLTVLAPSTYVHQVIRADSQRLKQILLNLISNAIKYTDKGHIAVVVDEQILHDITYCTLSVIDTGKGIRKEDQEKLFKRFEQVDRDTLSVKGFGTGLGLALVAEFASLHGGHVSCHSIFGEGSQFTVFIPLPSVGGASTPLANPPTSASL